MSRIETLPVRGFLDIIDAPSTYAGQAGKMLLVNPGEDGIIFSSAIPPGAITLTQNHILVGNASNVAADVAMSGDATIVSSGALTLVNTAVTPGTYGSATAVGQFTVDSKGRLTSAIDVPISITSLGTALTRVNDTNVTLTLSGSPSTALVNAAEITVGWSGLLALSRGGTNKNMTPVNGGVVWTDSDSMEVTAAGSAGQLLASAGASAPVWTTATFPTTAGGAGTILRSDGTNWVATTNTYPNTTGANQILYATSANVLGGNTRFLFNGTTLTINRATAAFTRQDGILLGYRPDGTYADGQSLSLRFSDNHDDGGSPVSGDWILYSTGSTGSNFFNLDFSADGGGSYSNVFQIGSGGEILNGSWQADNIPLSRGGTNASLAASNGGILYSTASAVAILSGTATAGQILQSGASAAPSWSTATYPATATGTGTILRANGTNWAATTTTYPNTATANHVLYATSSNVIGTSSNLQFDGTNFGIGGAPTNLLDITRSTNGAITAQLKNGTSGTSAFSRIMVANEGVTGVIYMGYWNTGYTTSGLQVANTSGLISSASTAMLIASTAAPIIFSLNSGSLATSSEAMRLTTVLNVKIGGSSATRSTTEGTKHLDIFDGTAPAGTLTNGVSIFSASGKLKSADAAGTIGHVLSVSAVNVVSPTAQNRTLTVDIGGTTYYITAKTTND